MHIYHYSVLPVAAALAMAPLTARAGEDLPYDRHTRMTMQGTIREVKRIHTGRAAGVVLVLETELEKIQVHLGPIAFVDAQPMKLHVNDQVSIFGSWISLGVPGREDPYLVAGTVTRGGQVMHLRDPSGRPLWRRPPAHPPAS